jgi:hypothetical protein
MQLRRIIAFLGCGLLLAATAQADVLLSNLPGTGSGTGTNLGLGTDGADRTKGVGLTMGGDTLQFVDMVALISNTTPSSTLSGGIYSSVGGNPGALLAAFTSVPIPASMPATEISITTAAPFNLMAGTSYWFVLDGPASTNSLLWQSLTPNTAPTPAAGITYDGYRFSSNGGGSWGSSGIFNGVTINAVPEPATLCLLGVVGLFVARRRR